MSFDRWQKCQTDLLKFSIQLLQIENKVDIWFINSGCHVQRSFRVPFLKLNASFETILEMELLLCNLDWPMTTLNVPFFKLYHIRHWHWKIINIWVSRLNFDLYYSSEEWNTCVYNIPYADLLLLIILILIFLYLYFWFTSPLLHIVL